MSLFFEEPLIPKKIPLSHARVCPDCWVIFESRDCPTCGGRNRPSLTTVIGGRPKLPAWKSPKEVWNKAKKRLKNNP